MSRDHPLVPPARSGSELRIFVSYAREDERAATLLVADLVSYGHKVWWDQSLTGGQAWWATILEQIRDCHAFIIVMSPISLASGACAAEISYAAALLRPILPIMVKAVAPQLLPPIVAAHQIVDYRRAGTRARNALRRAIETLPEPPLLPAPLPEAPPTPAPTSMSLPQSYEAPARFALRRSTRFYCACGSR